MPERESRFVEVKINKELYAKAKGNKIDLIDAIKRHLLRVQQL